MTTLADLETRADAWLAHVDLPATLEPCRDLIRAAYCASVADEEHRTHTRLHAMTTALTQIAQAHTPPTPDTHTTVLTALSDLQDALEVLDGKI